MKKNLLLVLLSLAFCYAEGKTFYSIRVYNGTYLGTSSDTLKYAITSGDSLLVKAWKFVSGIGGYSDSTIVVDWYLNTDYQFTAGGMVAFNQPGLIRFYGSDNAVRLYVATGLNDLKSSALAYPFSQSPNINTNNLHYKIVNAMGRVMEQGNFSGEIILRNQKPQQPLPAGIYFVIYYDALDNRQVLTDKVCVTTQ